MIQQHLEEWIRHPERLSENSLHDLHGLVERYPYFQTARLLYLKNLYVLGHPDFKAELCRSALYIADLSVLFYFIEGDRLKWKPQETNQPETGKDRTMALIDSYLSGMPAEGESRLPLAAEACVDYTPVLMREEEPEPTGTPLKGQELIDRFIERSQEGGKVLPAFETGEENNEGTNAGNVPGQPIEEAEKDVDENCFTETLAKIYTRQHRYVKALEIIKKLNLKYQKKNAYFADQIRFLERLIINAKSK